MFLSTMDSPSAEEFRNALESVKTKRRKANDLAAYATEIVCLANEMSMENHSEISNSMFTRTAFTAEITRINATFVAEVACSEENALQAHVQNMLKHGSDCFRKIIPHVKRVLSTENSSETQDNHFVSSPNKNQIYISIDEEEHPSAPSTSSPSPVHDLGIAMDQEQPISPSTSSPSPVHDLGIAMDRASMSSPVHDRGVAMDRDQPSAPFPSPSPVHDRGVAMDRDQPSAPFPSPSPSPVHDLDIAMNREHPIAQSIPSPSPVHDLDVAMNREHPIAQSIPSPSPVHDLDVANDRASIPSLSPVHDLDVAMNREHPIAPFPSPSPSPVHDLDVAMDQEHPIAQSIPSPSPVHDLGIAVSSVEDPQFARRDSDAPHLRPLANMSCQETRIVDLTECLEYSGTQSTSLPIEEEIHGTSVYHIVEEDHCSSTQEQMVQEHGRQEDMRSNMETQVSQSTSMSPELDLHSQPTNQPLLSSPSMDSLFMYFHDETEHDLSILYDEETMIYASEESLLGRRPRDVEDVRIETNSPNPPNQSNNYHDCNGGGNCGPNAIEYCMRRHSNLACSLTNVAEGELRTEIFQRVQGRTDILRDLRRIISSEQVRTAQGIVTARDVTHYLELMSQPGTYFDDIMLFVTASVFQMRIQVNMVRIVYNNSTFFFHSSS
jgi:hypothetical protein